MTSSEFWFAKALANVVALMELASLELAVHILKLMLTNMSPTKSTLAFIRLFVRLNVLVPSDRENIYACVCR